VQFTVETQAGASVAGIDPEFVSGTFAKLVAAADGKRSHWVSYIHEQQTGDMPKTCEGGDKDGHPCSDNLDCPGGTCTDIPPVVPNPPGARQADNGGGSLEDNGDGSYVFTYTTDPTTSTDPTWEPNLTHRAGLEIRINNTLNPDNPTFDLVPDGGAGSGHKDDLSTDSCNNCHGRLGVHGGGTGGRFTVEYCVTCHNDQTRDQGFGESLDMANMVHNIHAANDYYVLAHGTHDYSDVTYPRTLFDCANCHTASEDTPDGDDWKESVDSLSCGGCHADRLVVSTPDATTGLSTYSFFHEGVGTQEDGQCLQCHATGSNSAEERHRNRAAEEMVNFAFSIDDAMIMDDASVEITFTVSNPIDMTTYDITDANGPFGDEESRLRFRIAWSTDDYSNHESLRASPGQPVTIDALDECTGAAINCTQNVDGSYTLTDTIPLPSSTTGDTYGIAMEGRAVVDDNGTPLEVPIMSQIDYVTIDDVMTPEPRREIVDIALCKNCHGIISEHGGNRTNNIQVCAVCHNPNATDEAVSEASVDMKAMIHGIHDANASFGDGGDAFFDVTYPRHNRSTRECNACHLEGTYDPVDTTVSFRLATTTDSEADPEDPEDDLNTTFNAATCGGCHLNLDNPDTPLVDESEGSVTTAAHMAQNGSSFVVKQDIMGMLDDPFAIETCVTCHAAGKSSDVAVVHGGE
jgi:OmcA/MtrC family decaheme c-type cytochrome